MKVRFLSWTILFNLILVGAGLFGPDLSKETRHFLIINGVIGLGLRAKTHEPLIKKGN